MTTSLRYPRGYPFFDNSGNLLASGSLSYFRAGTSTLQNVYSDAAGAVALPNPLSLNAAGRAVDGGGTTVAVYLKDNGFNFKEVLANASGTVLYTDDNIPQPVDPSAGISDFAKPLTEASADTSATVTLVVGDFGKLRLANTTSNSITYALPSAALVGNGKPIGVKKTAAANTVTLDADGADTIDGAATFAWTEDDRTFWLVSDGANWHVSASYPANPKKPTVQRLTSGSGTYTPTAGTSFIRVRMIGGGGGGGAADTNNGANGTGTIFGGWGADNGDGGGGGGTLVINNVAGLGGTGGADGTGTLIHRVSGAKGYPGGEGPSSAHLYSGGGGVSPFGGAGATTGGDSGTTIAGNPAAANSGSGGGGGVNGASNNSAAGGGAGEYVEFYVSSPGATSYTVGAGGAGGTAGVAAGGAGGAGVILIEEFY